MQRSNNQLLEQNYSITTYQTTICLLEPERLQLKLQFVILNSAHKTGSRARKL